MNAKKKAAENGDTKKPKICCPPIPEETLYRLIDLYSVPVQRMPDERTAALWNAMANLKGWMEKKGKAPTDPNGMRFAAWHKLRSLLNDAVEANDTTVFDSLAKEWQKCDIEKPRPKVKQKSGPVTRNPWQKDDALEMQKVADTIESLIPALPTNTANCPKKIQFLEAVLSLQKKLARAPTRREIEERASISKNKVVDMAREMGLEDSLSRVRTPVN